MYNNSGRHGCSAQRPYMAAIFSLLLAGCGGGGSGSSAPPPTVQSGVFVDSAVSGLTYATATQSGTTDASGTYKYVAGETVKFSLYGKEILSTPAYALLTPFDNSTQNLVSDYSLNLIRFLVTVDTDSNPANGITLPAFTGTFNVNFDQDMTAFENDANLASFLTTNAGGKTLVSLATAVTHFNSSVQSSNDSYVLQLTGRTGSSVITNNHCSNNVTAGWQYTLGATSLTMVGSDTFNSSSVDATVAAATCTVGAASTLSGPYGPPSGAWFDCGPSCSYSALNHVAVVTDVDNRTAVVSVWHTPNTKVITYVKRIISDPATPAVMPSALSTFKEVITLN